MGNLRGMAHEFSMLQILNAALLSQGEDELLSESEGTNEGRLLLLNWPSIVEAELEDGNFAFSKRQTNLQSRQDGLFGYADAYLVPQAALHVRNLWTEDNDGVRSFPGWMQDGSAVHTEAEEGVFIEYVEAADPSFWGANFTRGVQKKLEAVLAGFKEEPATARDLESQAEGYFMKARGASSKSRSAQPPYKQGRFSRVRFTRA